MVINKNGLLLIFTMVFITDVPTLLDSQLNFVNGDIGLCVLKFGVSKLRPVPCAKKSLMDILSRAAVVDVLGSCSGDIPFMAKMIESLIMPIMVNEKTTAY